VLQMYDSIDVSQLPAGAPCYAGYVNGAWPTYSAVKVRFPHAHILSIAVFASADADCLDVEPYDADPPEAPGWVRRQQARGIWRPVIYCSASVLNTVVADLSAARISRAEVRLWSAHYGVGKHICGPGTCGYIGPNGKPVPACDGTQFTSTALGRNLDESVLLGDFFDAPPPAPFKEDDMPSGVLAAPVGVRQSISWPMGSVKTVTLFSDWEGVQGSAPQVDLRIGHSGSHVYDTGTHPVPGAFAYVITHSADVAGCSITRKDTGPATVGWSAA
jgi:hypothetical protein